jgi:hypothetical protein
MSMPSRALLCGCLLFAPLVCAQDNSLDRPASDFSSNGIGLTETLLRFSHQQNLRIALEYVDRASMDHPIVVKLQNKTVRQALQEILRSGRGYSFHLRNGIIEITNNKGSKRADEQLNTVIPAFNIADRQTAKMACVSLWWNLRMKLDPSLKGYGGDIPEGTEASEVKPAVLHGRTVREILAYIVLNSRAEGWIVSGPPECLGFTPHCGLWFLIETPPSGSRYGPLLQQIRDNL